MNATFQSTPPPSPGLPAGIAVTPHGSAVRGATFGNRVLRRAPTYGHASSRLPGANVMRKYAELPTFPGITDNRSTSRRQGLMRLSWAPRGGRNARAVVSHPRGRRHAGVSRLWLTARCTRSTRRRVRGDRDDAAGTSLSERRPNPQSWPSLRMLRASDCDDRHLAGGCQVGTGDGGPGLDSSSFFRAVWPSTTP